MCGALPGVSMTASAQVVAPDGAALFRKAFTPQEGLGPLYNEVSCAACHSTPDIGGSGAKGLATVLRVGHLSGGNFDPLAGAGGPFARAHAVSELGSTCALAAGIPAAANLTSVRNTPALYGTGLIDAIPDATILAQADAERAPVHGRPNTVTTLDGQQRVGRFGWKASTATLDQFVGEAFRNELGLTNPIAPTDVLPASGASRCAEDSQTTELSGAAVTAVSEFVASLPAPTPSADPVSMRGATVFATSGCASCHAPTLAGADGQPVPLYSDLLLHDLGADLDDKVVEASAGGVDWRTTPLWGLRLRTRYLHDGRAQTLWAAIAAHDGEAADSAAAYRALSDADRAALLAFLGAL
ncbi:MAG: hypothetical protein NVSMB2_20270 [Chloroflexota bacterium]